MIAFAASTGQTFTDPFILLGSNELVSYSLLQCHIIWAAISDCKLENL